MVSYPSVAFFGLSSDEASLVAVGVDGLYLIDEGGEVEIERLPTFDAVGAFHVSFENPDFVLVLTNINQRRSISGSVPMLVPRRVRD